MALVIVFFLCLLQLLDPSLAHPLCTDSRAPVASRTPLTFCPYNGTSCCNSADDRNIQNQFRAMNISGNACANLLQSILCARCDQFSGELFGVQSQLRQVPVLCNSTISTNSSQATNQSTIDYCSQVWDTCQNTSIVNSPFAPSIRTQDLQTNLTTRLTDIWLSKSDFCTAFGGSSVQESVCFSGQPIALNTTTLKTETLPNGICLEKIGNGSYLDMARHPDGSNRAFYSSQQGKIWLATIPEPGSGGVLDFDESTPFLDLTDFVHFSTEFGMMGIAFHPNFGNNGRFFASFNCDKSKWPGCAGRCSCNSDVNCDPSQLGPDNGAQPCQYQSVVAEFTANGTTVESPSARPIEVRRILTMGLPFTGHHAGQIVFGPSDGYLYFLMGDGGGAGDPFNFAQNKKSLLGKVMRLDVDNFPSATEITRLGLWGNYSIPEDNPYAIDNELLPEIWAVGLRNPWRCSFDSARPSYFMCADIGQDIYEEVNLITKGGNYGWRAYEGPSPYTPPATPGGNTSLNSITPILPVMGYSHTDVNKNEGSASITGGYFYRSMTDPCLHSSYLYGDLYAGAIWAGFETPENSGNFSSRNVSFTCAADSPIGCNFVPGSSLPALGYLFSFGEDNSRDVHILASNGVYRIVPPSRCNYACSKETTTPSSTTNPGGVPPNSGTMLRQNCLNFVLMFFTILSVFFKLA